MALLMSEVQRLLLKKESLPYFGHGTSSASRQSGLVRPFTRGWVVESLVLNGGVVDLHGYLADIQGMRVNAS